MYEGTTMSKIDIDKFVASLIEFSPQQSMKYIKALAEQELRYKDREIVEIAQESEDEKIRKELIEHIKANCETGFILFQKFSPDDILAWLEKQGEKPQGKTALKAIHEEKEDNVNKVEPKFKRGDWIISKYMHLVMQILNNDNVSYKTVETDGTERNDSYDFIERNFKLWTIADAKDGDVLAEDSCIFIIQKLGDNSTAAKTYCTLYDDGDFDDGSILYFDIDSTKPATKEQRDFLFQKIHDAGYEWDAEKKEIKKMEQKSKWDDDEQYLLVCKNALRKYQMSDKWDADIIIKWLDDKLKQEELKSKWSKEDEKSWLGIIDEIKANKSTAPDYDIKTYNRFLSWLNNIKQRIEKPTIIWHDVSEEPEEMKELLVEWESDVATWHTVGFYDAGSDNFREYNMSKIDNVIRWMYID